MSDLPTSLKLRALAKAQPLNVQLELTYRCNWRCVFCYNPRHHDVRSLSTAEWLTVLDDLRALGTLTVTLTGGEPLTRPDFFDIALGVRARAFALRIFTNGALLDANAVARIAALQPLAVEMSLHGATADVHERTTAIAGSFARMLDGARQLIDAGVNVVLKTPLTNLNEHQLDDLVALAASLGVQLQLDPHITARDDGDRSPMAYGASRDTVRRALELGIRDGSIAPMERETGGSNCGLGRVTMAVDPEGNVYPCLQWRHRPLGNVRETRLRDLWHASPARAEAAQIARDVNDRLVERGGAIAEFPFCPAIAYQESGDPFTPDAAFRMRAEVAAELRGRHS